MGFNVEMTGRSDYSDNLKMAIVGHAGAGKTLLSSTAPDPIYIFFREQPRIMSIANRAMPHVKAVHELDADGKMIKPVEEIMLEVRDYIAGEGSEFYSTVVIDTGDELQKALKEGKKIRNRGKWGISDWGWLADEYTAIVNSFIDLPKNVIVTYHLKNTQEGEDGQIFKEIALQGSAKDDSPGWFDIVGVLDTYESVDDKGVRTSTRGFLTQPTPRYSWVKDHSGQLPSVFDISPNFVGDFDRLHDLIYGKTSGAATKTEHEVLSVVKPSPRVDVVETHPGVPTPEEVDAKKGVKQSIPEVVADAVEEDAAVKELEDQLGAEELPDPGVATEPAAPESDDSVEEAVDQATFDVEEVEEGEEGKDPYEGVRCEVCGEVPVTAKYDDDGEPVLDSAGNQIMVVDDTLIDLGKVKYRAVLCQTHLLERRKQG